MKYLDVRYYAYGIANYAYKTLNKTHHERYECFYAWYILLTKIVQTTILLITGYVLNIFWPMLAAMFSFALLRKYAGGKHSETMWGCTFNSLMIMLASVYIGKFVNIYTGSFLLLISFMLLLVYSPRDTKNKPIESIDLKRKNKRRSIIVFIGLSIISIIFPAFAGTIIVAVFIECLSLINLRMQSADAFEKIKQ